MVDHQFRLAQRRLCSLGERLGVEANDAQRAEQEAIDRQLATLLPFDRAELLLAVELKTFREGIVTATELSSNSGATATARARQHLALTRSDAKLKDLQRRLAAEARSSGEQERLRKAIQLLDASRRRYRAARQVCTDADREDRGDQWGGAATPPPPPGWGAQPFLHDDGGQAPRGDVTSIREDAEFQQFFQEVAHKDQAMDQALDRIAVLVQRQKQQADAIREELVVQDHLIDEASGRVDTLTGDLRALSRKVKKATKQVRRDSVVMYLICGILLLALIGLILSQLHVF